MIQTSATGFDFPLRARYGSANSSLAVAAQVWQYLRQGQDVALLVKGCEFYSTFTYLAQNIEHLHPSPCATGAGVCSPMAAAAALGLR